MADHGKPKGKPKHAPAGGGGSEGPSGLMLAVLGIVAVVLLILFYSGTIGPPIPYEL